MKVTKEFIILMEKYWSELPIDLCFEFEKMENSTKYPFKSDWSTLSEKRGEIIDEKN